MLTFDSVSHANLVWGFTGGYFLEPETVQRELIQGGLRAKVTERKEFDTKRNLSPDLKDILQDTHTLISDVMGLGEVATRAVLKEFGIETTDTVYVYKIRLDGDTDYARCRPGLNLPRA